MDTPSRKQIKLASCTLDGKNKHNEQLSDCPDHYFLVLTIKPYNQESSCFLGLPFSSMKEDDERNYFRLNYGIDISNDDIIDTQIPILDSNKQTVVLCNKLCQVPKSDILRDATARITDEKYSQILKHVMSFVEYSKI